MVKKYRLFIWTELNLSDENLKQLELYVFDHAYDLGIKCWVGVCNTVIKGMSTAPRANTHIQKISETPSLIQLKRLL